MKRNLLLFLRKNYKEIIFQTLVSIVIFLIYSYIQDTTYGEESLKRLIPYKISFFSNYMIASMLINYVLLPEFYSKKRFLLFFLLLSLLIIVVILVDEHILEKIYFPDTRGSYFPGILFTLIETSPVIIVFIGSKFAWDYNKKQTEIEKLKMFIKENELQFLKSQINPHFLFNNLNNLYSYAIENSPKTPTIILELSSVLRYMLYDCREDFVLLPKEIEQLKNYTALNELQIEHRGNVQFKECIPNSNYKIAPLILMVFIENAFKHCTNSQSENISIYISIDLTESGLLTFTCNNSYLPVSGTNNQSKGIGLENVIKRLSILYPDTHKLLVSDTNNLYEVKLTMQLKPV